MRTLGPMIDERRVAMVKDTNGDMLRCEFTVYEPRHELKVKRDNEIVLRSVTSKGGDGTEFTNAHSHAQWVTLMLDDPSFEDHMTWPDLCDECASLFMSGQTSLLES